MATRPWPPGALALALLLVLPHASDSFLAHGPAYSCRQQQQHASPAAELDTQCRYGISALVPAAAGSSARANSAWHRSRRQLRKDEGDDGSETEASAEGSSTSSSSSGAAAGGEAAGGEGEGQEGERGSEKVSITDEDMGLLFSRLRAMREEDVELDKALALNWKVGRCEHEVLVKANTEVRLVQFNGDMLAFGTEEGDLYVISMSTADVINAYEGHEGEVTSMAFDGEFLITGGADRTVRVHKNTITPGAGPRTLGACIHTLKGHTERVIGVVRIEGTRLAASAAPDGRLIVWDLDSGESVREVELAAPALCLGATEGYLAVGMMNGQVAVYTHGKGDEVLIWQAYQRAAVRSLYFPSQSRIITGGGNGVVRYWDLLEGGSPEGGYYKVEGRGIAHEYRGHNAPVVALQGDEVKIVSAASDGVVRVHDMKMGEELFRIEGHSDDIRSLQFDRRFLITDGTMNTIVVHDFAADDGADEFEIEGFTLEDDE